MPTEHPQHHDAQHGHPEHTGGPAHHPAAAAAHEHGPEHARPAVHEHRETHHTGTAHPTAAHPPPYQEGHAPHHGTHHEPVKVATHEGSAGHPAPHAHAEPSHAASRLHPEHSNTAVLSRPSTPRAEHVHVASGSHFNDPIPRDGKPHGYSRRSGDAPDDVKQYVVNTLIAESHKQGLGREDTAHVLAIARLESGFNPDAAAPSTSASGIGQFIHATGEQYGLSGKNRFDLHDNARAMVAHYVENKELAQAHGKGEAYIYKYYHDGPKHESGGLALAHKEVLPYLHSYTQALGDMSKGVHHVADSMKVFLADSGHNAREFLHGISERARHLADGHHETSIARAESPFQRDHLERVAFHPGTQSNDGLGLMTDRTAPLASALADTMRLHGFDANSLRQANDLAQVLVAGAGERKPGQDVLIIHKEGDALASLASRNDVGSLARPGDTVLDMRTIDRVASTGLDTTMLTAARQALPVQTAGMSNLEVAQLASSLVNEVRRDMGRGMEMA